MAKVNTYERKGAISSDDVEIVNPEKKFSIDDTAKGNNPLMGALDISTDKMYSPGCCAKFGAAGVTTTYTNLAQHPGASI